MAIDHRPDLRYCWVNHQRGQMPRKRTEKPPVDFPAVDLPAPLDTIAQPLVQLKERIPGLVTAAELQLAQTEPLPRREPPRSFELEKDYPQAGIRILVDRQQNTMALMFDDDKVPSREEKDRMQTQAKLSYDPYRHLWQGDYGSFTTRMAVRRLAKEFDKERTGGQGVGV